MAEKPNAFHTLGLEIGNTLKGVTLGLRRGKPFLEKIYESKRSNGNEPNVKPLYIGEDTQPLMGALSNHLTVSLLNPGEAIVRQMEVKLKKVADIDAVLAFQAEPLLPYPVDQAVVDRVVLGGTADGTLLSLLAVRKDHLKNHLDLCHSLNIEPEVVSCPPMALAAFSHLFAPSELPQFILHIGSESTVCVLAKEGKPLAAQAFFQGLNHLTSAFEKDREKLGLDLNFNELNFADIKKEAFVFLHDTISTLRLEITRTLYALGKQSKGLEISQILTTGEGGHLQNLIATLCQPLNKKNMTPQAIPEFEVPVNTLERLALPIGAALTALNHSTDEIDFRQGEFAYPNPWKRYKIPLTLYMVLAFFLASTLYFLGNTFIKHQEDGVRKLYSELLESMHKPYDTFEKEYVAKFTGKKVDEVQVTPIKNLDQADLIARIHYLEKEIESNPQTYPLLPNVPTVSDVLAWLSTHPNVVMKDPKTGALKPLLQIENFSYSFVKRPEMTKKQEKYQVRVELEFSSPTPKYAREFHDALIASNAIVDPKGEVKWSTNRGLYRASFYLKDRTTYAP